MDARDKHIKAERQKARELRKSRWWHNKVQSEFCYYCQCSLDADSASMDHIVPISQGGKSIKSNVVACCKPCNSSKAGLSAVDLIFQNLN